MPARRRLKLASNFRGEPGTRRLLSPPQAKSGPYAPSPTSGPYRHLLPATRLLGCPVLPREERSVAPAKPGIAGQKQAVVLRGFVVDFRLRSEVVRHIV